MAQAGSPSSSQLRRCQCQTTDPGGTQPSLCHTSAQLCQGPQSSSCARSPGLREERSALRGTGAAREKQQAAAQWWHSRLPRLQDLLGTKRHVAARHLQVRMLISGPGVAPRTRVPDHGSQSQRPEPQAQADAHSPKHARC